MFVVELGHTDLGPVVQFLVDHTDVVVAGSSRVAVEASADDSFGSAISSSAMDSLLAPSTGGDEGRCDVVEVVQVGMSDSMWHFNEDGGTPSDVILVEGEAGGCAPSDGVPIIGRLGFDILEVGLRCVRFLDRDDEGVAGDGGHKVLGERAPDIVLSLIHI